MVKLMTNDGGTTTTAPPSEYGNRDWIVGYRPSPTPGRELVLRPKNDKEGGGGDYDDDKNDEDKEMHPILRRRYRLRRLRRDGRNGTKDRGRERNAGGGEAVPRGRSRHVG